MSSDGFRERKRDAGTDPDAADAAHSSPRLGLLTGGSAAGSGTGTTAASLSLLPRHWRVLDVVTWALLLAVLLVLVLIFTPMGDSTAAAGRRALAQMTSDDPQTRAKVLRWVQEKGLPLEPCPAALTDHIPCHDPRVAAAFPRARNAYRERHCPESGTAAGGQACLVPPPRGYRAPVRWPASLHEVWRANVPEGAKVAERKGRQGWVREEGEKWVFPGGGTMFAGEGGAGKYIQRLARWIPALDAAGGDGGDRDEDGGGGGGGDRDEDGGNGDEDNGDGGGDSSSSSSSRSAASRASAAHRGTVRTALDIGCGVASFGGYLLRRNVLTLSLAPRDSHKAQVQLALERGIPALVSALGTQRLPVPSRAFDLVHCSRCLVDFADRNGTSLLEADRVLRPGGFFVLSGPPVRWPGRDAEWDEVQALLRGMCYTRLGDDADPAAASGTTAVFRKAAARDLMPRGRCYAGRGKPYPPRCAPADDPDAAWYVPLQACVTRLPDSSSAAAAADALPPWPQRLYEPPRRLSKTAVSSESLDADFRADTRRWKSRIARYEHLLGGAFQDLGIRNILDMNAHYGGFAAGLAAQQVWVMNVVPVGGGGAGGGADSALLPDTLPVVVDRGLIGVYHHWCEPFSTYPRTYDLVHVVNLRVFTTELTATGRRCSLVEVLLELDRILRPRGTVIFRDGPKMLDNIARLARALRWDAQIFDPEAGAVGGNKKLLVAKKRFWTLEDDQ